MEENTGEPKNSGTFRHSVLSLMEEEAEGDGMFWKKEKLKEGGTLAQRPHKNNDESASGGRRRQSFKVKM